MAVESLTDWNQEKIIGLRKKVLEHEFSRMNSRQREAVFAVNGPLLVLAGAGSGKTTVLVNRIANIVRFGDAYHSSEVKQEPDTGLLDEISRCLETGAPLPESACDTLAINPCPPWKIMSITFTNKAANEMKERLSSLLGKRGEEVWASTFHSTCARMLRRSADRLGFSSHFAIYDSDDSKRLMKECQKALGIDDKKISYKSALSEISHAKDAMIGPEEYLRDAGNDERAAKIGLLYRQYQSRLKNADAMDFDDLIFNTIRLFQKNADVLDYYQNRFRYILVDEYQDTNRAQYLFVKLLSEKSRNLCVVGDDDQSIYQFRGATIENILSFEKTFPNAHVIRLEQNYRSTKTILSAANAVIANNENRKGKTLWTENPAGKKIDAHVSFNEQDEAAYIAGIILDEVSAGRHFSDFAVLYRMNSQSNTLERAFTKSSIPHRVLGGLRFFDRKEVRDMIAYLSVICNPSDEIRLLRIINCPKRAIGDKTVAAATQIAAGIGENLFYVLKHAEEFQPLQRSAKKLTDFANMIQDMNSILLEGKTSLADLYRLMLKKTGYVEALAASGDENAQDRIDNVNELTSSLIQYEEENGDEASLPGYLEEVALLADIDNYDSSSDSVVMMTMHSAKGLEFPVVFLPGFEEGIFPGIQAIFNPSQIEEERRLAYVAITRAKEELHLVCAGSRMIFGSTQRNQPSRFAEEIPKELLEVSRAYERKTPAPEARPSAPSYRTHSAVSHSFGAAWKPAAEKSAEKFRAGDTVIHKTFGRGMVLSAVPMGNDTLLEIAFDQSGTKKLMANYARLQKK
jgi:DNA helicase-2/ATP-dependent DNA helicase PcrA